MRTSLAALTLLVATGLVVACTEDSKDNQLPQAEQKGLDGGAEGGTCAATGNGIIDMTVTGIPATAKFDPATPLIHFKSAAGEVGAVQTGQVSAAAGAYTFTGADFVYASDPVVRTAYRATVTPESFCVADGKSTPVTATYAAIPSSNKLWTTNNSPSGQVIGFAGASLTATGTPAATVAMKGPAGNAIAFDKDGNMWTLQATVSDAPLQRYAASTLGTSGDKTADRTIAFDSGCIPGPSSLAFSPTGDLYMSIPCADKIVRFAAADLAGTGAGSPAPSGTFTGFNAPAGMAFDMQGNLWIADSGAKTVLRYDAATLAAGGTANLVITPQTESKGDLAPDYLAFDAGGNLWATSFGGNILYRLGSAEQAGTGAKTVTPPTLITLPVDVLLEGLAFDESNNLWATLSTGKIGRLSPAQQGTSSTMGSPTIPEVILTSPDLGNTKSLAFFPPPSTSPLYGH